MGPLITGSRSVGRQESRQEFDDPVDDQYLRGISCYPFVIGHGMGGLISLRYVNMTTRKRRACTVPAQLPTNLTIFSSPTITIKPAIKVAPDFGVVPATSTRSAVTPAVVRATTRTTRSSPTARCALGWVQR